MTKQAMWQEQWERVKRFYERFKQIDRGKLHNMPSSNYEDEAYAFFVFCYHLKDWIIEDDLLSLVKREVERFVQSNECLSYCADICNGIKHLRLDKRRSDLAEPGFHKRKVSLELAEGRQPSIGIKFELVTEAKTIDAFELATECVDKWREFIEQNITRKM